jgi:hypothetical protein
MVVGATIAFAGLGLVLAGMGVKGLVERFVRE